MHEIDNLKVHIERGCLSRIPPGGGSTRNENLHKNLRAVIARSRLGCELAEALLATFFYIWNKRRSTSDLPSGCVRPILLYRAALEEQGSELTAERFGITPESRDPENAIVCSGYDPEVMQSILCEMSDDSTTEYHNTSNDRVSDSELQSIFCQAVNMSVLYNHRQGKNKPKIAPEQLQRNGNFTEATAAEINHNFVCMFIEVSAVYRFCYKPNLTVLKSCMMLSRSTIIVLCFGRDLFPRISLHEDWHTHITQGPSTVCL